MSSQKLSEELSLMLHRGEHVQQLQIELQEALQHVDYLHRKLKGELAGVIVYAEATVERVGVHIALLDDLPSVLTSFDLGGEATDGPSI